MHCLVRFNAHMLPSDLSLIPRLSQADRATTRANMQPLATEMPSCGAAAHDSSESDGDKLLKESEFEDDDFNTDAVLLVSGALLSFLPHRRVSCPSVSS